MKSAIRNASRLGRKNIPAIMQRRNISNQGNNLVLDPIVPKMWTGTAPIPVRLFSFSFSTLFKPRLPVLSSMSFS